MRKFYKIRFLDFVFEIKNIFKFIKKITKIFKKIINFSFTKFINLWIKFKIKKSNSLKNFFVVIFVIILKPADAIGFSTPHGSQIATTVAILSPALPQGES